MADKLLNSHLQADVANCFLKDCGESISTEASNLLLMRESCTPLPSIYSSSCRSSDEGMHRSHSLPSVIGTSPRAPELPAIGSDSVAEVAVRSMSQTGIRRIKSLPSAVTNASPRLQSLPAIASDAPANVTVCRKGKDGLRRIKTFPLDSSASNAIENQRRNQSLAGRRRRSVSKAKSMTYEGLQAHALKALATQMASKKTLENIIRSLCSSVRRPDGKKAFLNDDIVQSVNFVLSGSNCDNALADMPQDVLAAAWAEHEPQKSAGPLSLQVLNVLSTRGGLRLTDVMGQILFRFRKADVLQEDPLRATAKDLSWIDITAATHSHRHDRKPTEMVEAVFRQHAQDNGRMTERTFLKLMDAAFQWYLTEENGVVAYQGRQCSLKRTDCQSLFFAQTHQNGNRDVSCGGFKVLLMNISETIEKHPCWLFVNIGEKA